MRARVRGLLGCLAVCAAAWVLLDLLVWQGPLHVRLTQGRGGHVVVEVAGGGIMRQELQHALREHLWLRDEAWPALDAAARAQARWAVLEKLVNARLIRTCRLQDSGGGLPPPTTRMRREGEMMRRQFADEPDYARRLDGQQHTQQSLDAAIREAQLDEAWVAARIAPEIDSISTEAVRAWYDQFKETLCIPAAHHAAHLFLARHPTAEARIREMQRQLLSGEKTFAALVAAHSEDLRTKGQGGDLGWFTRQRMPADFAAAVETLEVGQLSVPIATSLGWHLVIVRERRPSRLPALAEVRAEVLAHLIVKRREDAVKALLAALRSRCGPPLYELSVINSLEPLP